MKTIFKILAIVVFFALLYFLRGILKAAFITHPIGFIVCIIIVIAYLVYFGKYAGFL